MCKAQKNGGKEEGRRRRSDEEIGGVQGMEGKLNLEMQG